MLESCYLDLQDKEKKSTIYATELMDIENNTNEILDDLRYALDDCKSAFLKVFEDEDTNLAFDTYKDSYEMTQSMSLILKEFKKLESIFEKSKKESGFYKSIDREKDFFS